MYDLKYSQKEKEKALKEYFEQGKKREMMIIGNKVTFGFKFVTGVGYSAKNQFVEGNKRQKRAQNA